MKIYRLIFSYFLLFASRINENKLYASLVAVSIFTVLPILNIMKILVDIFEFDYSKIKASLINSFFILFIINILLFISSKDYLDIEIENSQKSKLASRIIFSAVLGYILISFILLLL
jgi:hypothetical protein